MSSRNYCRWTCLFLFGIIFVLLLAYLASWSLFPYILPRLTIQGEPVGCHSWDQALARLKHKEALFAEEIVWLEAPGEEMSWTFSTKELGLSLDLAESVKRAMDYGKGFRVQAVRELFSLLRNKIELPLLVTFDAEEASRAIEKIGQSLLKKPRNAQLEITADDQVEISPAIWGRKLDEEFLLERLALLTYQDIQERKALVVKTVPMRPEITTEDIQGWKITGRIAMAATNFNAQNKPRTHNIHLAAEKIHQYLLAPQAVFSFNEVVGPRSKEAGYQEALIIMENEFEPGLGGGVCQVSSTLYNAVLKANLPILERRRHSRLVDYVPPGLDATVAYDYIDFQFINNTEGFLLFHALVDSGMLVVKIFGNQENIPEVEILRRVVKVLFPKRISQKDPTLAPGERVTVQKGSPGYEVQVVRRIRVEGETVMDEIISYDTYPPVPEIVKIGP
ncbi:MAG: VanW family protein [Bacillota bacterium]|jgi:vancomycin resistance protein YoaR